MAEYTLRKRAARVNTFCARFDESKARIEIRSLASQDARGTPCVRALAGWMEPRVMASEKSDGDSSTWQTSDLARELLAAAG